MPLTAGVQFGPSEILGAIGVGGMGEVIARNRARNTKLNRDVALKILPDAEFLFTFFDEQRLIAPVKR